jgi:antitoxin (DNA-binding transcriptional repressor) of toxin-antitoxin stability system
MSKIGCEGSTMTQVSVEQIKENFDAFLAAVAKGETFLIARGQVAIAQISPARKRRMTERKSGTATGLFTLTSAFDEPLEDFRDYM